MAILLIGGTGLLGGQVAESLAARGEPLRALVRSGRRALRLRALGVELLPGDMRDPRALKRALEGMRVVVSTAQGSPFDRRNSFAQIDGAATQALIAAAREASVEQFVLVSALKADEGAASVPQLGYKLAAEQALQASGMRYSILRPSSFQETFGDGFAPFKKIIERSGLGLTLGNGKGQHSFVALRDVARTAALALDRAEAHNMIVPIGGPEDLNYREAYARIAQLTRRRILVTSLPRPLLSLGGLLATPALPELRAFFAYFAFFDRAGYTCSTPAWLVEALGRRRSFDEGIREMYRM